MQMSVERFITLYVPAHTPEDNTNVYMRVFYETDYGDEWVDEILLTSSTGLSIVKYSLALMLGRQPRPAETKEFVDVIKGAAMVLPRRERMYPDQVEEEELPPLAQVIEAIALKGGLRATPTHLNQRVTAEAQRMGLADTPGFPTTPDQLGTQLAKIQPLLARRGVPVERFGNGRPREWEIHPKEGGCKG